MRLRDAPWIAVAVIAAAMGCGRSRDPVGSSTTVVAGDARHGRELIADFECARCHTIANVPEPPKDRRCVGCHADIQEGRVKGTPDQIARWQVRVAELGDVPSLVGTGRFRRAWIRDFLLDPHDLRPGLVPTMPKLPLNAQQAADIATYLSPTDEGEVDDAPAVLEDANLARGRALLDAKGCGVCHKMTGVEPLQASLLPSAVAVSDIPRAVRLAPDLRLSWDRWRASTVVAWLQRPSLLKPGTLMPDLGLSDGEARDIAAYILSAPLGPVEVKAVPERLPVLARKVAYDEVAERVLHRTCWHCHAEPDFERGDGGPGNSGGFGFKGRGLNLGDYASTFAGFLDDTGHRTSVFAPGPEVPPQAGRQPEGRTRGDGTPRIVAAMLARQREEAGQTAEVRGMPLGLPALSAEDVQLVETWIAQGRPR